MISGNLEYIISSLPYLSFSDTEEQRSYVLSILEKYYGYSIDDQCIETVLDQEVGKFLSPKMFLLFQQINLSSIHGESFQKSKNEILVAFSMFTYKLKTDLLDLRRSRKNESEPTSSKNSRFEDIPESPLDAEIYLIKLQWDYLEELSFGHYADFSALVVYKLKLLLLFRWWSFDQNRGLDNFITISKIVEYGG
jgi:hypothetical protein